MSEYVRDIHYVSGTEKLALVELVSSEDFTASATNYWTFTLFRRKSSDSYNGETLAEYTLSNRSLSAGTPVTMLESLNGTKLNDGEVLRVVAESVGSPASIGDARVRLTIQRMTR